MNRRRPGSGGRQADTTPDWPIPPPPLRLFQTAQDAVIDFMQDKLLRTTVRARNITCSVMETR